MFHSSTLPALALALFLLPAGVRAQDYYAGWPASRIEAFEVRTVRHLVPGALLHFSVFGLPEGRAKVNISGASRPLYLQEADPGHYQGDYTLAPEDHITAASRVTIALRSVLGVAAVQLDGTLASSETALRRAPRARALPLLGKVQIIPATAPASGSRLKFLLEGAPEGAASIAISGLGPSILLSEIYGSGHYFGSYTLRDYDAVTERSVVSAALRVAGQLNRVSLGQYFQRATAPMPLLGDGATPKPRATLQGAGAP